jgi:hypothetical protein
MKLLDWRAPSQAGSDSQLRSAGLMPAAANDTVASLLAAGNVIAAFVLTAYDHFKGRNLGS